MKLPHRRHFLHLAAGAAALPAVSRVARAQAYYETRAGARVFAAGSLNFSASLGLSEVDRLLSNVWARLSVP